MIRLELLGILEHRDVALRAVSAACKLVTAQPQGRAWNDFQNQVVSAVSEAFNNIALHAYGAGSAGPIELRIDAGRGRIAIELRDWGRGFDPATVGLPDLDALPESGLGIYIMRAFMDIDYLPGRPNVLTMTKQLVDTTLSSARADGTEGPL